MGENIGYQNESLKDFCLIIWMGFLAFPSRLAELNNTLPRCLFNNNAFSFSSTTLYHQEAFN